MVSGHRAQSSEAKAVREKQIEKLFRELDTGNKGYLDKESLSEGFRLLNHPLQKAVGITNDVISRVDQSGDGTIQYPEFLDFVERTEEHLWNLFQSVDKDHNGKLDKQDVAAALESSGLSVSASRLDQFFNSMDANNDNSISFNEWRDFLLFIPVDNISIRAAYRYFIDSYPITSEGDVFLSDETLGGVGYFLAGGIAGAISRTATAPFDRLKVYLIAQTGQAPTVTKALGAGSISQIKASPARSPLVEAARTLWRHGGITNFFVGNGLNIIKVFPESAIKFGSFEASKRLFAQIEGTTVNEMSGISSFLAGGIGGAVSQFAVYPIDTLKFRIQCEAESSNLRGNKLMVKTAQDVWRTGGILGYYRGIILGIGGIFPYAALDLGTFEAMKRAYIKTTAKQQGISEENVKIGNLLVLTMGALSGSVGASVVYPINLLRTRLQAQGTAAHPQTYTGMIDVFQKTVRNEGYHGMFRGLVPNLLKVAPAVSISYLVYENCKALFGLK
ncbi:mitochondrial carrier domain-containing protein [Kockiozyma suomiensis]|uniref:mitochondrial carrier domain-containing protein n=1 Tax=Kockiozyma suomiensis TaxID=1337062 RepID=UPI003343A6A3